MYRFLVLAVLVAHTVVATKPWEENLRRISDVLVERDAHIHQLHPDALGKGEGGRRAIGSDVSTKDDFLWEGLTDARRDLTVEEPVYVPLGDKQSEEGSVYHALRWIMSRLQRGTSRFLLYPYAFDRTPVLGPDTSFPQGSIIATHAESEEMPLETDSNWFRSINDDSTVDLQRAKALYDHSIAILHVAGPPGGPVPDCMSNAIDFCAALHQYLGRYDKCWFMHEWLDYRATHPSYDRVQLIYINATDVAVGHLFEGTTRRFGMLIIPDIATNTQDIIASELGTAGLAAIKTFADDGGTVYASGKGALVVEDAGLVAPNTFSRTWMLKADSSHAAVKGCPDPSSPDPVVSDETFAPRVLCFSQPHDSDGVPRTALLGSPLVNHLLDGLMAVSYFDAESALDTLSHRDVNGNTNPVDTGKEYPHVLWREENKGNVVIQLSNPVLYDKYMYGLFNALFMSMAKPVIMDASALSGQWEAIPALEQLALTVDISIRNLYNADLDNMMFRGWLPQGILLVDPIPDGCTVIDPSSLTPPSSAMDGSWHLECEPTDGVLAAFETYALTLTVFIEDILVTQRQFDIPVVHPKLSYTIPTQAGAFHAIDYGPVTVDAYMAALLRVDVSGAGGVYPIPGAGSFKTQSSWTENKEDTMANDVSFTSVVPLISPILDNNDPTRALWPLHFDHLYYRSDITGAPDDYPYPCSHANATSDERDEDYLDWRRLGARGNTLGANWDTPVVVEKTPRDPARFGGHGIRWTPSSIHGSQYQTNVDNDVTVVRQRYFPDADSFYAHTTQRMMAFIDPTTPEGFVAYNDPRSWGGSEDPPSWMMNSDDTALRVELLMARLDVHFAGSMGATGLPQGVSDANTVFTVDRYTPSNPPSCTSSSSASPLVQGHFGDHGGVEPGYKPHEWSNGLLNQCGRNIVRPEDVAAATGGDVTLTHYLMRMGGDLGDRIRTGDDVMYMVKDVTGVRNDFADSWYYDPAGVTGESRFGKYEDVQMVWGYGGSFTLAPEITRKGARVRLVLPDGVKWTGDPVSKGAITVAADHLALVRVEWAPEPGRNSGAIHIILKRGHMPDESHGSPSTLDVNLELLNTDVADMSVTMEVDELVYIFTSAEVDDKGMAPETAFERFEPRASASTTLTFARQMYLSLPALKIDFMLRRGDDNDDSYVMPYEYIDPFARFGTYIQELKARRTVAATSEFYPLSNPGLVTGAASGFSYMSMIGIGAVPFRDYVEAGSHRMVPAAPFNSHMRWRDIWGRAFSQPSRTTLASGMYSNPPPLRHFSMTTTVELLDPVTGDRWLEWPSDREAVVRAQIKLLNNYPKWWDITACKANEVWQHGGHQHRYRIYNENTTSIEVQNTHSFVMSGWRAQYGTCLSQLPMELGGQALTQEQADTLGHTCHCNVEDDYYEGCDRWGSSSPRMGRRPNGQHGRWNHAPQVDSYWPEGYTEEDMWSLNHYDYDETAFDKAHKYHMDNRLPSIDNEISRPQNVLVFPLFKGLGYSMTYDKTLSHSRFGNYKGWWSDQLQARDPTIIAGQTHAGASYAASNPDLTTEAGWVMLSELDGVDQDTFDRVTHNIYACEFNRDRLRVDPANTKVSYPPNVFQNYVVPVNPALNVADLTSYTCDLSSPVVTPEEVAEWPNYLHTDTARDWLYFAAALRGGARENVNILYSLKPLENSEREGLTKIQDGARFVYYNPASGGFASVDNRVTVIQARRTDLVLDHETIPEYTTTIDGLVMQLIELSDPAEIEREWTMPTYFDYYGYGDAGVSVYVGGVSGTDCILNQGETTYVKVELHNNAGYDWKMLVGAMESVDLVDLPAGELLEEYAHSVRIPTSFNFLEITLPEALASYVTVEPSPHHAGTAAMNFASQGTNLVTIRDAEKSAYYLRVVVAPSIPDALRGRMHEIEVGLVPEWFEHVPGGTEPAGVTHDYVLDVPSFLIGFPYRSDDATVRPEHRGKVFWTSGRAFNVELTHRIGEGFTPVDVRVVTLEQLDILREGSAGVGPASRITALENAWSNVVDSGAPSLPIHLVDQVTNTYSYDVSAVDESFPWVRTNGPDTALARILVRTEAKVLEDSFHIASHEVAVGWTDFTGQNKDHLWDIPMSVFARGAYLIVGGYNGKMLTMGFRVKDEEAKIHKDELGIVEFELTVVNIGSDIAYHADLTIKVAPNLELTEPPPDVIEGGFTPTNAFTWIPGHPFSYLTLNADTFLTPNDRITETLYFYYKGWQTGDDSDDECKNKNKCRREEVPTEQLIIAGINASFEMTSVLGERAVMQTLEDTFAFPMISGPRPTAALSAVVNAYDLALTVKADLTSVAPEVLPDVRYMWLRMKHNFGGKDERGKWVTIGINEDVALKEHWEAGLAEGEMMRVSYQAIVVHMTAEGPKVIVESNEVGWMEEEEASFQIQVAVGVALGAGFAAGAMAVAVILHRRRHLVAKERKVTARKGSIAQRRRAPRPAPWEKKRATLQRRASQSQRLLPEIELVSVESEEFGMTEAVTLADPAETLVEQL